MYLLKININLSYQLSNQIFVVIEIFVIVFSFSNFKYLFIILFQQLLI